MTKRKTTAVAVQEHTKVVPIIARPTDVLDGADSDMVMVSRGDLRKMLTDVAVIANPKIITAHDDRGLFSFEMYEHEDVQEHALAQQKQYQIEEDKRKADTEAVINYTNNLTNKLKDNYENPPSLFKRLFG